MKIKRFVQDQPEQIHRTYIYIHLKISNYEKTSNLDLDHAVHTFACSL